MADIKSSTNYNYTENKNFRLENVLSLPGGLGSTHKGLLVCYDGHFYMWDGSQWVTWSDATWGTILGDIENQSDLVAVLAGKENAFAKNTAFNKNFGTTDDTVAEGNHTHPAPRGLSQIAYLSADSTRNTSDTDLIAEGLTLYVEADTFYELFLKVSLVTGEGTGQKVRMQLQLPNDSGTPAGEIAGTASGQGTAYTEKYMYGAAMLETHYSRQITQEFDLDAKRDEVPTTYNFHGSFKTTDAGLLQLYWGLRSPGNQSVTMKGISSFMKITRA